MLDAKEVLFGFGGIGDDLIVASVYVDCDLNFFLFDDFEKVAVYFNGGS